MKELEWRTEDPREGLCNRFIAIYAHGKVFGGEVSSYDDESWDIYLLDASREDLDAGDPWPSGWLWIPTPQKQ